MAIRHATRYTRNEVIPKKLDVSYENHIFNSKFLVARECSKRGLLMDLDVNIKLDCICNHLFQILKTVGVHYRHV